MFLQRFFTSVLCLCCLYDRVSVTACDAPCQWTQCTVHEVDLFGFFEGGCDEGYERIEQEQCTRDAFSIKCPPIFCSKLYCCPVGCGAVPPLPAQPPPLPFASPADSSSASEDGLLELVPYSWSPSQCEAAYEERHGCNQCLSGYLVTTTDDEIVILSTYSGDDCQCQKHTGSVSADGATAAFYLSSGEEWARMTQEDSLVTFDILSSQFGCLGKYRITGGTVLGATYSSSVDSTQTSDETATTDDVDDTDEIPWTVVATVSLAIVIVAAAVFYRVRAKRAPAMEAPSGEVALGVPSTLHNFSGAGSTAPTTPGLGVQPVAPGAPVAIGWAPHTDPEFAEPVKPKLNSSSSEAGPSSQQVVPFALEAGVEAGPSSTAASEAGPSSQKLAF